MTANDICNALRGCAMSHADLETVLACLASSLQFSDLSHHTMAIVVDMVDEIVGQVEDDRIQQQRESAWHERENLPYLSGTSAQLDALTIQAAA